MASRQMLYANTAYTLYPDETRPQPESRSPFSAPLFDWQVLAGDWRASDWECRRGTSVEGPSPQICCDRQQRPRTGGSNADACRLHWWHYASMVGGATVEAPLRFQVACASSNFNFSWEAGWRSLFAATFVYSGIRAAGTINNTANFNAR